MTKIVQGIGDAIGDVVKGVVNVVKGVADGVGDLARSIADSPIGKAILIAGAVYFGGAALAGGFGEMAGGGSFLSGLGTGVESAATGLSNAWSSTLAGNFGEAAATIGDTYGTAYGAGESSGMLASNVASGASSGSLISQGGYNPGVINPVPTYTGSEIAALGPGASEVAAVTPAAASTGTGLTAGAGTSTGLTSGGMSATGATGTLGSASPYALAQAPAASTLSTLGSTALPAATPAAGWWAGVDPYLKTAAVMGGTQVVGGLISGAGQAKAAQEQRDFEVDQAELARQRRNKNMGAQLDFSAVRAAAAEKAAANPQTVTQWDPQAAARALIAQYYAQAQPTGGVISKYMPGGTG